MHTVDPRHARRGRQVVPVLLQELRARLATTPAATLQVPTLRERLFKLGARVQVSARRIVLHLPSAFPWLALWQAVTQILYNLAIAAAAVNSF